MLEVHGLVKTYPPASRAGNPVTALMIDSWIVRREERVALAGPSGSGKSTLLNLIAGLIRPTSGSIRLGGVDLTRLGEKERDAIRTRQIGIVLQSFHLLPGFTALENVMLPLAFAGIKGREREKRARRWLERVGLGERMHHQPHQLSNGEQQRVAVARALAHEPGLVLADEPTASLDEPNALHIVRLLMDVCMEQRASLIVSTHDSRLLSLFGRIVRLSDGRLVSDETVRKPGEAVCDAAG